MMLRRGYFAILVGISLIESGILTAQTFTMSTVAGNGKEGFSGDGGPATQAQLFHPAGVEVDAAGAIYIADYANRRIRKVSPDGVMTTIAGDGGTYNFASCGDGGPAVKAQLKSPYGVGVDRKGIVYIADQQGNRVRKVTPDGMISTLAGDGVRGFSGDGGPAARARVSGVNDVAFDSKGNIYLADTGNNRVRRVGTDGNMTTYAGSAEKGFAGDGGPATAAKASAPAALFVDTKDNVYFCDFGNHAVRKVTPEGIISTLAGTGEHGFNGDGIEAAKAQLYEPCGVAVDARGQVYIADSRNERIRVIRLNGKIETIGGTGMPGYSGDGGPATEGTIRVPDIIDIDAKGNLYLAEYRNNVIRKLTAHE